tara:strand:- start:1785 stop:2759 length:975 start_codon:yes stop_codon:yes gene_type:complete
MMKLMHAYSIAVYSAQECTFYDSSKTANLVDFSLLNNEPLPNSSQLELIQRSLTLDRSIDACRIIILVPDAWLSVSQHRIDHLIPSLLLPLAALSYAVETTFSPPDSLLFSYQYELLPEQQSQLTTFACSSEWAQQLCLPFQSIAQSCLLMPIGQWEVIHSRNRSWSSCSQRALSVYQPEKSKRLKARRLCWSLVVFSLLVHSVASVYFFFLHQESAQALIARQKIQATQSAWSLIDDSNEFSASVLNLVQALPMSARLGYFESEAQRASLQMTLPTQDLELLLEAWHQQNPDWRWEVEQQPHRFASPTNQKEVVDVSIEVFKN